MTDRVTPLRDRCGSCGDLVELARHRCWVREKLREQENLKAPDASADYGDMRVLGDDGKPVEAPPRYVSPGMTVDPL